MATTTVSPGTRASSGPSTIMMKVIMAVTGLIFIGFLLAHMYGNLMIFGGQAGFDEYAHHLRTFGEPMLPYGGFLWVMRIGLIVSLVLHVWAAMTLWHRAGVARRSRYVAAQGTTYGHFYKRAMRWGGLALLLFVVFHLLHFTTKTIQIGGEHVSPAAMVISSFQEWWAVLIYVVAVLALGMHLLHGVWGAAMTLGLNTDLAAADRIRWVAILVATLIVVGFLIPPLAILFGLIP